MAKAWKAAEAEVAGYFGGTRRVRVSYSEKIGDIIHPKYSIEVKWGKQVPSYLDVRQATNLTVGKRMFNMVPSCELDYFRDIELDSCAIIAVEKKRKKARFLEEAIEQARGYNPTLVPLVCVKRRSRRGFVCIWEARSWN